MTMTISRDHGTGHHEVGVGHLVAQRLPAVPAPVLLVSTGPRLLVQARDQVSFR
jgi:hypothetical protein